MKKQSLSFKLIAGGILAVALPIIVVGVFSITKASNSLDALAREQVTNLAKDLTGMTQMVLQEEIKLVKQLSVSDTMIRAAKKVSTLGYDPHTAEIKALGAMLLRGMKSFGDNYESILVTDPKGLVFADGNNGKYLGVSLADRKYFQIARQGQANVSTPVKSKLTGEPIAPVSTPVYSLDGQILGTVTAVMKMDFIARKIVGIRVGKTGYPFMVDHTGLTIAHPNPKHVLNTNLAKVKEMEEIMGRMLAGKTGVGSYTFEGIYKIAGYAPVEMTGWSIGVTQPAEEFLEAAHSIRDFIIVVAVLFLVATTILVFFFARSISRPIMSAVEMLNSGADQVAAASGQVSSASQSLAEGASEQAASIEETSSSLEEMSSMTKQSAENAGMADNLMKEAKQVVTRANDSMSELTTSMEEISKASEETSKIIKTIDEIAFQTNLLALNAAVEAARAGEAGAGFAVVADEVRNLAMRAADAAKNTSGLIEGTVKKIKDGGELVAVTNEAFEEVDTSTAKVGALVDEIAAAANEQSQGIGQINTAVAEMDKVVQQNAANAEESASASEEMNAQAEQMKGIVGDLVTIVGGGRDKAGTRRERSSNQRQVELASPDNKNNPLVRRSAHSAGATDPEQVIPLADADFRDF